ncbi:hypothetical protein GGH94_003177 [Coemansia aciculifera]|uniref:Uncharacterized protein n=1 Tax=Coemansia aciculifera TaxID=417176 RepID=A0A9W8IRK0_9FUNG|nr:hypothetical protein GGH94_003177 [Coemansia aciculifera]
MWLRHKLSEQSRTFSNGQNQAADEWRNIPKNPVFYPPTPKKERGAALADESPVTNDRSRPGRLMSRLKTIFVPKNSTFNFDSQSDSKQHAERQGTGSQNSLRRQPSKLGAFRRSKLVARSPVREDSISPDLRALADSDRIPSPTKGGEYNFPLDAVYSPAAIFAQADKRSPRRMHTVTTAYSPSLGARTGRSYTRSPGCLSSRSPDRVDKRDEDYCTFLYAHQPASPIPCSQNVARSFSLDMPSFQPIPLQQQQHLSLNDTTRGSRSSQLSESTAIAVIDSMSQLIETGSQVSLLLANESNSQVLCESTSRTTCEFNSRIPCSPSLQTFGLGLRALNVYNAADLYLGFPLPSLPRLELDVFEASRTARRPYSEGFAEHAQMTECDCAFCDNCDSASLASTPSNQRAMYIRSSCADAGLVKSTFDLVKLLPSAPQ